MLADSLMKREYLAYSGGREFQEIDVEAVHFAAGWSAAIDALLAIAEQAVRVAPAHAEIQSWFPRSDWHEQSVEWHIERRARVEGAYEACRRMFPPSVVVQADTAGN